MTQNDLITFLKTKEEFGVSDAQLLKDVFANYKPSANHGWRLTTYGLNIISKYIEPLHIELTDNITYKEYVMMAKCFNSPYYIKEPQLVLFDLFLHTMVSNFGLVGVLNMY